MTQDPKTVSEIDSQKTSFDENLNAYKSSIAPAWLNTSHRDKMAMAPPSVLQPRPQQLNFRASTGSSKMPDEPAKSNLAALIAKYDRK